MRTTFDDDPIKPEVAEGSVRVQFYIGGQWRTLLPDVFDKFNEQLQNKPGELDDTNN